MFVRRLVSGVRSSCEASATSWRCAPPRLLERPEHRVEARARAGRARRGRATSIREAQVARRARPRSVAVVSRRTGASAARATSAPSATASATPPTATRISSSASRLRARGRPPSSGRTHLDARCPCPSGAREHAHVRRRRRSRRQKNASAVPPADARSSADRPGSPIVSGARSTAPSAWTSWTSVSPPPRRAAARRRAAGAGIASERRVAVRRGRGLRSVSSTWPRSSPRTMT